MTKAFGFRPSDFFRYSAFGIRIFAPLLAIHLLTTGTLASSFRFADTSETSLTLYENNRPVLVYNHGIITHPTAPADRARSSYIHPLHGLDGEILTDDFPADHYHHRGLFWAWPHVRIGEQSYDLWMLRGIRHQFERWIERGAGDDSATLALENGWYIGERKVLDEQVRLRAGRTIGDERVLDIELILTPTEEPISLLGAAGKSYGGLTLRYAPRTDTLITVPAGVTNEDLAVARLEWADLSARFEGRAERSGAAVFIHPTHPDYPPTWLTRHYGVLCVGWPGVESRTLQPGESARVQYRVWIHRGAPSTETIQRAYDLYVAETSALRAELKEDRVSIYAGGRLFTEYLFRDDEKYPYFYPVNGPGTGQSVTTRRTQPFPHHSSLFFSCDKVNGGNYWQEGLERGRIVSKAVRVVRNSEQEIVIEQECRWERPDAEAPFADFRTIRITAPAPDVRLIDFDVTLEPLIDVRIQKNNHSLFSARMTPALNVQNGGALVNAAGGHGEQETFGVTSPWMHAYGTHHGMTEGLAILSHPENPWSPRRWFTRNYGFFSPTPMNWLENDLKLPKGETVRLRYRVVVHTGELTAGQLDAMLK